MKNLQKASRLDATMGVGEGGNKSLGASPLRPLADRVACSALLLAGLVAGVLEVPSRLRGIASAR